MQGQKRIGHYVLGKTIGEGTFGKVKEATHTLTQQKVAIKILMKEKIVDVADVERVSRQIHILKLIRHPSIIQLYQIIQTTRHLFLVMQFVENKELFDHIVDCGKVPESQACKYFKHILSGVAYLHELNIVHRDLKPQNLLLDWKQGIKIVDFGLSNTYKDGELLKTACGSPCYAAPQMISSKKYNGLEVDIWSIGVILFAMVCGYLPFQDDNTSLLYKKILAGEYVLPDTVSEGFGKLLNKVLCVDPAKRSKLKDIYEDQWCNLAKDIPLNSGIIVGYHRIPVDGHVLSMLQEFEFDITYAQRCIEANKHNHITTTYYLLLKKHLKTGYVSPADLSSLNFDYSSVEPFKRTNNQNKFHFFANSEESPLIQLDTTDIHLQTKHKFNDRINERNNERINSLKQNEKIGFKPITKSIINNPNSSFVERKNYFTGSKKFNNLRMYLKQEKKKMYQSQSKKYHPEKKLEIKKKTHAQSVHSRYESNVRNENSIKKYDRLDAMQRNSRENIIIRTNTDESEEKSKKRTRYKVKSKFQKLTKPYVIEKSNF